MYNSLADYYDQLVADPVATKDWADWICQRMEGNQILDLACGSGEIDRECKNRGFHVTALDLSRQMLDRAKEKEAADAYVCRDMRNLDGLGQYDAICCCCDSFNYLLDRQEILSFFQEVWKHLKPGGWFFFDTHSTDRLDEFREEWNETGTFPDGCDYQWSIRSEDDWIYQDFAFYRDGQTIQEHHIQRVYDPQWLADCFTGLASEIHIVTDFHTEGIQPGEKIFYQIKRRKI